MGRVVIMFVQSILNKVIDHQWIEEKWSNLTLSEKELLTEMVMIIDKRKSVIDELVKNKYGPFLYYKMIHNLLESNLVFILEQHQKVFYLVPREVDFFIIWNKTVERGGKTEGHNIFELYIRFCIKVNDQIHGTSLSSGEKNDDVHTNNIASTVTSYFKKWSDKPYTLITTWIEERFDDFLELLVYSNAENQLLTNERQDSMELKKHFYQLSERKVEECCSLLDEMLNKGKGDKKIVQVHEQQWLFPRDDHYFTLWIASIFGEIKSIGSMVTINFSESTVQKGKSICASYRLYQHLLHRLFPQEGASFETFDNWWQGSSAIFKEGSFVFYSIRSQPLMKQLLKMSEKKFGSKKVMGSKKGMFISTEIVRQWEQEMKKMEINITSSSREFEKHDKEQMTISGTLEFPNEWKEVQQLPEVTFTLMTYKGNFLRRLVRQSQIMKMPLLIEEIDGKQMVVEVKRLIEEGDNVSLKTYDQRTIDQSSIRRIALYNPLNDIKSVHE